MNVMRSALYSEGCSVVPPRYISQGLRVPGSGCKAQDQSVKGLFEDGSMIMEIPPRRPDRKAPSGSGRDDRVIGVQSAAFMVAGQVQV
jgi:hypothetical protein